jgi:hypothetical protein
MIRAFKFSETSPATAITAASANAVVGADSTALAGVCVGELDEFDAIQIQASLVGATGGVLNVYVQSSLDGGASWYDLVHFPQLADGASAIVYVCSLSSPQLTPVVVGTGTSPALAANTVVGGAWGDRLRLLMVAGTGTNTGAAVVVRMMGQRKTNRQRW